MAKRARKTTVPGSERLPVTGAKKVGKVRPEETVEVTVRLRRAGKFELRKVLGRRSARAITREELASRFGASAEDAAVVKDFAREHGLAVGEVNLARRSITLRGTAAETIEHSGRSIAGQRQFRRRRRLAPRADLRSSRRSRTELHARLRARARRARAGGAHRRDTGAPRGADRGRAKARLRRLVLGEDRGRAPLRPDRRRRHGRRRPRPAGARMADPGHPVRHPLRALGGAGAHVPAPPAAAHGSSGAEPSRRGIKSPAVNDVAAENQNARFRMEAGVLLGYGRGSVRYCARIEYDTA